jgi:hypothetical protein
MTACAFCRVTAEQLKQRASSWECSHVHCPNRRRTPVLDNLQSLRTCRSNGFSDVSAEVGSSGCYRVAPTTRD